MADLQEDLLSGVEVDNSGASAVRADLTISCRAVST